MARCEFYAAAKQPRPWTARPKSAVRGQIYAKSVSNRPSIITAVYSLQQYTAAYTAVNSSIQQHTTLYNSSSTQRHPAVYGSIRQYTAVHNTIHSIQQYTVYSRVCASVCRCAFSFEEKVPPKQGELPSLLKNFVPHGFIAHHERLARDINLQVDPGGGAP